MTWNYFQTCLSSILSGSSLEDETIALLVAPGVCLALVNLLHSNPELGGNTGTPTLFLLTH